MGRVAEVGLLGIMNLLHRTSWRLWMFPLVAIPTSLLDATLFRACRCWHGDWELYQSLVAQLVIGLVGLRFLGAWVFGEQNNGWKYYFATLAASPFLIWAAFRVASLALPADLQTPH